jgi:NTE family protein
VSFVGRNHGNFMPRRPRSGLVLRRWHFHLIHALSLLLTPARPTLRAATEPRRIECPPRTEVEVTIIDVEATPVQARAVAEPALRAETRDGARTAPRFDRPLIGLVLGSGAARGFAHIGVLHALKAAGIAPDIVVGTSIGALVGGCYANGRLDPLEAWARALTLRRVLGYLDVRLGGSGLIGGGRLAARLQESLGKTLIESLPVRFAAIATEVGTGHEVWLARGSLALALRASYALPGIFPPVSIGGRWLVDGALVNPMPISVARAFGARVVIAVNLNADRFGRGATIASHGSDESDDVASVPLEKPRNGFHRLRSMFGAERALKRQFIAGAARPSFSTVMIESFNVMQDRLTRMRLAGDPPDVHITPRFGQLGFLDFHRAADAIDIGRTATERALDAITESVGAVG